MIDRRTDSKSFGQLGRTTLRRGALVIAVVIGVAGAVQSGAASVKIRTASEKTFDFTKAHTWGWNPNKPYNIVMARSSADDPEAVRKLAEPIILGDVVAQMPARGLTQATGTATPDLTLTYYLLLTAGTSAQTQGQFLPAVLDWGLPPFAPATTSIKMIEQGSLVFDMSAKGNVVWRGAADAKIDWELDQAKRIALLHEAVREILKKYPPKK